MDVLSGVFILGLAFFAWRGYKKGLWRSLAGLAALLLGCISGLLMSPLIRETVALRLDANLLEFGLPIALCIVFTIVFNILFALLLWRHKDIAITERLAGVAFGTLYGVVVGLWFIWSLNLLFSTQALRGKTVAGFGSGQAKSPIVQLANASVSKVIAFAMSLTGSSDDTRQLVQRIAAEPQGVITNLQQLSSTPQTKAVMSDPELKSLMVAQDADSLMRSDKFQSFLQQPQMQELKKELVPKGVANPDLYVTEKLALVKAKLEQVYSDDELQSLLNDPQIKDAINRQNTVALLLNPKFRQILQVVMGKISDPDSIKTETIESPAASFTDKTHPHLNQAFESQGVEKVSKKDQMFMWQDDKGQAHYTDWKSIPKEKRDSAIKIDL